MADPRLVGSVSSEDHRPARNVTYAADQLALNFDDEGQIKNIVGEHNARLVSTSATAETTIRTAAADNPHDSCSHGRCSKFMPKKPAISDGGNMNTVTMEKIFTTLF